MCPAYTFNSGAIGLLCPGCEDDGAEACPGSGALTDSGWWLTALLGK